MGGVGVGMCMCVCVGGGIEVRRMGVGEKQNCNKTKITNNMSHHRIHVHNI